jgi:hypothetical protein
MQVIRSPDRQFTRSPDAGDQDRQIASSPDHRPMLDEHPDT